MNRQQADLAQKLVEHKEEVMNLREENIKSKNIIEVWQN